MAGNAVKPLETVSGMGKVLKASRMAGPTHLVGILFPEFHPVHLMAVKATDILLTVGTDPPFTIGNAVAFLAGFRSNREDHPSLVGMIFIQDPVAGFTGDPLQRILPGFPVILTGMTNKTFPFLSLVLPF